MRFSRPHWRIVMPGTALLDLDHLGAEIGHSATAERAGEQLPQLSIHPQVGERAGKAGSRIAVMTFLNFPDNLVSN